MKITVLDAKTSAMDDLSYAALSEFGDLTVYDRTPENLVFERASGCEAVLTNKVPMFEKQLAPLADLKYIGILATGYNNVDLQYAKKRGITVTNIPSYGTDSVAQAVFAHILHFANAVAEHSEAVKNRGEWCASADISFCVKPLTELAGKTLGIIGYGEIGRKVAQIGSAFGMEVAAFSPSKIGAKSAGAVRFADSADAVFAAADIISLNCLLNASTNKIVNARTIARMKDGVWIVNTGRGGLVDESDLASALRAGKVGAYGCDVLSKEPPEVSNPLLTAPNCCITPHNAWTTFEARRRLIDIAVGNLRAWIDGSPRNVVGK